MAAEQILRYNFINDTGTPANPNGDGTFLTREILWEAIYDAIDEIFTRSEFNFGGRITVEGFGDQTFSAGGAGNQRLILRNTSAGVANMAQVLLGNDATASAGAISHTASNFTPNGIYLADALVIDGARAGGISIGAANASATIRHYINVVEKFRIASDAVVLPNASYLGWRDSGGTQRRVLTLHSDDNLFIDSPVLNGFMAFRLTPSVLTEQMRLSAAGVLFIGDNDNTKMTHGLTINQGTSDNEIIALKSSDVAHGITDEAELDTFGVLQKCHFTDGGVRLKGLTESTIAMRLQGLVTTELTSQTASDEGAIVMNVSTKSGTTYAGTAADVNLLVIRNHDSGACTKFIFASDGNAYADVSWTTFDVYRDTALLSALNTLAPRSHDVVRDGFGAFLEYGRDDLVRAGIVTQFHRVNGRPHAMVNFSKLSMLHTGALVQQGARLRELEARIAALEAA